MTAETAPDPIAVPLDLRQDVTLLTAALMDINSVSGNEAELADAVETALQAIPKLRVVRDGDAIIARTELGRPERVILAGHLDTVPLPITEGARGTVPSTWESGVPGEGVLYGRGATDMKGGVAVMVELARWAADAALAYDLAFLFFPREELGPDENPLPALFDAVPLLTEPSLVVVLEPTDNTIQAGC
ncbi:MAG TPA: succinyl-diaminopimelate desuccinylase, partial [Arthrobacter bacterium]|nr:succinyl-diaminopimelate desuccinylase [Arthrobacter sp.]